MYGVFLETTVAAAGLNTIYYLSIGDIFVGFVAGSDEVDRTLVTLAAGETYTVTLTGLYGGASAGAFSAAKNESGTAYWSVVYATGAVNGTIAGRQVVDTGGAWRVTSVAPVDGEYSLAVDDNDDAQAGHIRLRSCPATGRHIPR
ncbi:hypothetical protein [Antarctobacter sp.]|uniref:hypothetical protein n=1 Tax=Antarctobacter sp. TaxID=1872577 RepID=UPI002B27AB02|nr:hypothetical protein [Antarctobacter sp.]